MNFREKLNTLRERHEYLSKELQSPELTTKKMAEYSKEYSDLLPIIEKVNLLQKTDRDIAGAKELLADPSIDADTKKMAEEEVYELERSLPDLEKDIQFALIPKDEADTKNAIMEIRAGTGGDEAALFASDLFSLYQKYAGLRGWRFEIMEISENDLGGYREAIATIAGTDVFGRLKFESGVHRVQRVPTTETQGRVHTSTATVAVLPEAEEVDVKIEDKDLRIDVFRSSGPGGQSVNTTDSAVRITHIPTGLVVSQQDEKSQHKNRAKALKILRSRLYDLERQKKESERSAARKGQIGTGDRSERIRTYNFPQSRVTDHRIGVTLYDLDLVMIGSSLDKIIEPLIAEDQLARLADI
jgi:peptide chain release factor 1